MKKLTLLFLIGNSLSFYSQMIKDLKFETVVPEAENNYVAVPRDKAEDGYGFGYIYFDSLGGYTYKVIGTLKEENGKLKVIESYDQKVGYQIQRINNLGFKSAIIPDSMLKKLGYSKEPEWLKSYKTNDSENEKIEERASVLNGANYPNFALPMLEKLHKNGDKSKKLYFELMFSYNALNKFAEAEKMGNEAFKNAVEDDLIRKEYLFSLAYQKKIDSAEVYLNKNLSKFTNVDNRMEVLINMTAICANENKLNLANKWLEILKSQPEAGKYQKNINILDKIIKEKQSKIQ